MGVWVGKRGCYVYGRDRQKGARTHIYILDMMIFGEGKVHEQKAKLGIIKKERQNTISEKKGRSAMCLSLSIICFPFGVGDILFTYI